MTIDVGCIFEGKVVLGSHVTVAVMTRYSGERSPNTMVVALS